MKKTIAFFTAVSLVLSLCFTALAEALPVSSDTLDYADGTNWVYWASGDGKEADLFIIAPTADTGCGGNTIIDLSSEKRRNKITGALNMELGIYDDVCTVYAPFYRQVTAPVYDMPADIAAPYFALAYGDVCAAFETYLSACDSARPLILAGFSQGSDIAIHLMKDYFGDRQLADRLVACYAIGWRLTDAEIEQYPHLKPAGDETDTGVIIAFNSEAEYIHDSLLVPSGMKTHAINPLNWKTDDTPAAAAENPGACFTDYSGTIVKEIPEFCGAYIDGTRGTLKVPGIDDEAYPGGIFENGVYHIYDYQFFFRSLEKNVSDRLAAWKALH